MPLNGSSVPSGNLVPNGSLVPTGSAVETGNLVPASPTMKRLYQNEYTSSTSISAHSQTSRGVIDSTSIMSKRSTNMSRDTSHGSMTGVSLEFDDYPLELVSTIIDDDAVISRRRYDAAHAYEPLPSFEDICGDIWKPRQYDKEEDRILDEGMITDYGRRSWCDYPASTQPDVQNTQADPCLPHDSEACENNVEESEHLVKPMEHSSTGNHTNCGRLCLRHHGKCYTFLSGNTPLLNSLKQICSCPPHGCVSQAVTYCMFTVLLWILAWAIDSDSALPGGSLFALFIVYIVTFTSGKFAKLCRLPSLVGMLLGALVLTNIPHVDVTDDVAPTHVVVLSNGVLVVFLIRTGLDINVSLLRHPDVRRLRLAFLPGMCEAVTCAVTSRALLHLPWMWSILLGSLVWAVDSSSMAPGLLSLLSQGYGTNKGIHCLVDAAIINDICTVTAASVMLGVISSRGSLVVRLITGPLQVVCGLLYGGVTGVLCSYLPHPSSKYLTLVRTLLLLVAGGVAVFGCLATHFAGAGAIGCLVTSILANRKWQEQGWCPEKNSVRRAIETIWLIVRPLLFALVGIKCSFLNLEIKNVGCVALIILVSTSIRIAAVYIAAFGMKFGFKEKMCAQIAWLPRGTLQIAMCTFLHSVIAKEASRVSEQQAFGQQVVLVVVCMTIFTSSLSDLLLQLTAKRLLPHSDLLPVNDIADSTSSKQRMTQQNNTTKARITTEFETVT